MAHRFFNRLSLPLATLFSLWLGLSAWSWAAPTTYSLGVVPQFTPVDIGQRWTPVLERIRQQTGINLQIRTSTNIPAFETEFLGGIPDFVFLNPYHMVMASKAQQYRPLVHGKDTLSGILVVNSNSAIKSVQDLKGATLAFPAPNAFGASLYMRALLAEREKIHFTPTYVGTHQNVYRHVIYGDALGGGGVEATLQNEPDAVRSHLRVIYRTPETASHPLAVHPRVPKTVADQVLRALQQMNQDENGRRLLDRVELSEAVEADYALDYAPLEKLSLERYIVIKK